MDNQERLHRAMDAALYALADVYAKIEARANGTNTSEEGIAELAGATWESIKTAPEQFYDTDTLGDVSLPFEVVVTLLANINTLDFEANHLAQYEKYHYENLEKMIAAIKAFNNPRETVRAKYNQDTLKVLGLDKRPGADYRRMLSEFNQLTNGPDKVGITEAQKILSEKHGKSPETIRKGLERQRKKAL